MSRKKQNKAGEPDIPSAPVQSVFMRKKRGREAGSQEDIKKRKTEKLSPIDGAWNEMLDLKEGDEFTVEQIHVRAMRKYFGSNNGEFNGEVVSLVKNVFLTCFDAADQAAGTMRFIGFIRGNDFIWSSLEEDDRYRIHSLCWNILNKQSSAQQWDDFPLYFLDALPYFLEAPADVAELYSALMMHEECPRKVREALLAMWFVLLPNFLSLKGQTADAYQKISVAQISATAYCRLSLKEFIRLQDPLLRSLPMSRTRQHPAPTKGPVSECKRISVISPVPAEYLGWAVAAGCTQEERIKKIEASAGPLDVLPELPEAWLLLMRQTVDPQSSLTDVMANYTRIQDSLKQALLGVHDEDYLAYLIAASMAARSYPIALGDPDVVIDCHGFEVLVRQYHAVVYMAELEKPPQFSFNIGPPGHHCGVSSPAGFCFSNTAALTALLSKRHEVCVVLGLDINADNGSCAIFLERADTIRQPLSHYDVYDSSAYPYQTMPPRTSGQYEYIPFDVAMCEDTEMMKCYLQERLQSIEGSLKEKQAVHCVVSLGWDSHIDDHTFGEKNGRFTNEHMTFFYSGLRKMMDCYPDVFRVSVVPEGGYELPILSEQVKCLLDVMRRPPRVASPRFFDDGSGGDSSPALSSGHGGGPKP